MKALKHLLEQRQVSCCSVNGVFALSVLWYWSHYASQQKIQKRLCEVGMEVDTNHPLVPTSDSY